MAPHDFLSDEEIRAIVEYIKSFSSRFSQTRPGKAIILPPLSSFSLEQLPLGQLAYQKNQCVQCHGPEGKGNGVLAKGLAIKPADLTQRPLKVGSTDSRYARTIPTGMEGTPCRPINFYRRAGIMVSRVLHQFFRRTTTGNK
jgi:cytochrome c553